MKRKYVLLGLILAGLALVLSGCDVFGAGVSAKDRMKEFSADLNAGNYSSLWEHTDGGMTNQAKVASFWTNYGFAAPFTFSMSGDSATGSCTGYSFGFTLSVSETTGMFGTEKIYKITKITRDGTTIFQ